MKDEEANIDVFIAYARKDAHYLDELRIYLKPLDRDKTIKIWYDGEIVPGTVWEKQIKTKLHHAEIILLLVSAYSLDSDYFYDIEMKEALVRHRQEKTIVVPIILSDCPWERTDLSILQALPKDGKPLRSWDDESKAYTNIVRGIIKSIEEVKNRRKKFKDIKETENLQNESSQFEAIVENESQRKESPEKITVDEQDKDSSRKKNEIQTIIENDFEVKSDTEEVLDETSSEELKKPQEEIEKSNPGQKKEDKKEIAIPDYHSKKDEKQKENVKQKTLEKKSAPSFKKYGIFAGIAITGIIALIFVVNAMNGSDVKCTNPVKPFADAKGKIGLKQCEDIILTPTYKHVGDFSEGLAVVEDNARFGFIYESGQIAIPVKYEQASGFSDGKAFVTLNGDSFYIDKNEKCVENCPDDKKKVGNIDNEEKPKQENNTISDNSKREYDGLIAKANRFYNKGDFSNALKYFIAAKDKIIDDFEAENGIIKCKENLATVKSEKQRNVNEQSSSLTKESTPSKIAKREKIDGHWTINLAGTTWLAKNLNIEVPDSWCYDNKNSNCDKYGRLYTYTAAKKACAMLGSGWRLPHKDEWNDLRWLFYEDNLKANSNLLLDGGSSGFSAQLAGIKNENYFSSLGLSGHYWLSIEHTYGESDMVWYHIFENDTGTFWESYTGKSNPLAKSCRCVKN